jgi:hypothetical protein
MVKVKCLLLLGECVRRSDDFGKAEKHDLDWEKVLVMGTHEFFGAG